MSRWIPVAALIVCIAAVVGTTSAAPVPNTVLSDEQERLLARSKKFAQQGKIDMFVVVVAALKLKADDVRMWEPAVDFGSKLMERAEMKGDSKPQDTPSDKDFATYLDRHKPKFKRLDETYFRPDPDKAVPRIPHLNEAIQAPGVVDPAGIAYCLVLSRGSVQTEYGIQHSVVFTNGNVIAQTIMQSVVMICDGDVTVGDGNIGRSVIVARGNITAKAGGVIAVMAGGKITLENKEAIKAKSNSIILEKTPNTLGVVFFELSTVGVEVKVVEKSVAVSGVTVWKPCGKAGLKVGDVILEVAGKKPTDAESLRRLLRDALALGDATVKLKRGDKVETVKIVLPE